ncbi:MAG: hypothetical protein OXU20_28430, partial [Myxococcales bacterium]|nr:hypothetical protein [Myxococcales bacterium]
MKQPLSEDNSPSPHPSPRHVMIVQVIGFAGLSVTEGNTLCIFDRGESAAESSSCARARDLV